jgi:hypothetical protein
MLIEEFRIDLQQRVRLAAESEGAESTLAGAFVSHCFELLLEAGELQDPRICEATFETPKMQINGYNWDDEREVLTLVVADYSADLAPRSMTKADLVPMLTRVERFAIAATGDLAARLEESTDAFDAVLFIKDIWPQIVAVRILVLSNSVLNTAVPSWGMVGGKPTSVVVWDLARIAKLEGSGRAQEPVDVTISDFGVPYLEAIGPYAADDYDAYLLAIPGDFLAAVYEEFGPRLLELNVRSFLQTRGKTNQGIQRTLKEAPARFLAYNNGLSMTATQVEVDVVPGGNTRITRLLGLQIVNGGQTTASLFHASRRAGMALGDVLVQSKISVLSDEAREEFAPLISKYANTQNVIRMADFSANDPFHVELEKLSRATWAPAQTGTQIMTQWFYERARGQYPDALARERTPARKRAFSASSPRKQLFVKTDVAKFEHAWAQLPHSVALGAEKNFNEFTQRLAEVPGGRMPDAIYFQHLVAKAIMWRATETAVGQLKLGGYRSVTVAYTISLISRATSMRVDLEAIWRDQDVPRSWRDAVEILAPIVHSTLVSSAGTRNVLEWAKKADCWLAIQTIVWQPPAGLATGTSGPAAGRTAIAGPQSSSSLPASEEEIAGRELIGTLGSNVWFDIASWAKETANLQPWQRSLSFSIGSYLANDRQLSAKQIAQGVKIVERVAELGFKVDRPSSSPATE